MKRRKVLLIEDDDGVSDALATLLHDAGYQIDTASDGMEALIRLRAGLRPCLILLDLMMPRMDGYQFRTEQLRSPALAKIPVVVLTAGSIHERVRQMGAVGVLQKPVKTDLLLALLARYCG